jgi:hypothetical protein
LKIEQISAGDPVVACLAQTVADAIVDAQDDGLTLVEALSVASIAVAEYARTALGDDVLESLAETIEMRKGKPLPEIVTDA